MNIQDAIGKIEKKENLTEEEMRSVFDAIMSGEAPPEEIKTFLVALHHKGETTAEITGAAKVMREKSVKIDAGEGPVIDTCGTGGTSLGVFNVSTASAFVVAACGVKVAKHGNRAASSKCGSADVLEELGVKIDVSPEVTERCVKEINIGFLFAPLFHGAMKHAIGPRKEIGHRTIFNILGPLSNPASCKRQVLGVYDRKLVKTMAEVLKNLGSTDVFVVHGDDGLDEVTITGSTIACKIKSGKLEPQLSELTPEKFGLEKAELEDIKGGSAGENAEIIRRIFLNEEKGPKRDIVLMNASVALVVAGMAEDYREGVSLAVEAIDSGKAMAKLEELIRLTNGKSR